VHEPKALIAALQKAYEPHSASPSRLAAVSLGSTVPAWLQAGNKEATGIKLKKSYLPWLPIYSG